MNAVNDHASLMDQVYRYQRFIYDATRAYFLLGRDTLIDEVQFRPGAHVVEIGVGTARNLIRLARLYPMVNFYGLDASQQMLVTAASKASRAGLSKRITLRRALAEDFDHQATFGLDQPFDAVIFSYSLSMVQNWKESFDRALANLKPEGVIYIVDFWDQKTFPFWFQTLLRRWLDNFHVKFKPELLDYLERSAQEMGATFSLKAIGGSYAFLAKFHKPPAYGATVGWQ